MDKVDRIMAFENGQLDVNETRRLYTIERWTDDGGGHSIIVDVRNEEKSGGNEPAKAAA